MKIVNKSKYPNPEYKTELSAGMDLHANMDYIIHMQPLSRTLVPTGIFIALDKGYEAQIRSRSGMVINSGLVVGNSPGTIDADYRGEIKVIIINMSNGEAQINPGDRIAQMVITKHEKITWENVDSLDETERGDGGFGSTGR